MISVFVHEFTYRRMYVYICVCVTPRASIYSPCIVLFSIYRISDTVLPYLRICRTFHSLSENERDASRSYWEYEAQNFSSKVPVDFVHSLCTDYRLAYYPFDIISLFILSSWNRGKSMQAFESIRSSDKRIAHIMTFGRRRNFSLII